LHSKPCKACLELVKGATDAFIPITSGIVAITRRQFLHTAGTGVALGLAGSFRAFGAGHGAPSILHQAGAGNPLRIPPTFSGDTLAAVMAEQVIWPGATTSLYTYGGESPGPTFRVRSGDQFSVRLANQLEGDEHTNIHWHGLVIPPAMDGHPKDVIMPGETFDYSFKIEQRAATCWYHPHPHESTGRQVYMGMAGLFIIEDDEEQALGLPAGDHDVPLVIQDRRPSPTGELIYELTDVDHENGLLGDSVIVNGTSDPYLEVESGLYRFRILNGSNARIYDLAFADNRTFQIIATDGGLLDRPYPVTYAFIAPGERIEILVEFTANDVNASVIMKSLGFGGGSGTQQGIELPIIRFDIVRAGGGTVTVPATLATLETIDPSLSVRDRTFELRIDHSQMPHGHMMNGKVFDMTRVDEQVRIGDLEIWTFSNISFLPHPMHLHGAQFQVLSRTGVANLVPTDFSWKDVVYVRPFQTVRVLVRFGRWPGLLLVHCHNLEHEDHGMMLNFEMVDENVGVEEEPVGISTKMDLH
jgi:FtsP/CotA-like multicopper oxidase with cupredoxin domain